MLCIYIIGAVNITFPTKQLITTAGNSARGSGNISAEMQAILPITNCARRSQGWPRVAYHPLIIPERMHPLGATEGLPGEDKTPLAEEAISSNPMALRAQGAGNLALVDKNSYSRGSWAPVYAHAGRVTQYAVHKGAWCTVGLTPQPQDKVPSRSVMWPDGGNPFVRKFH